MSHFIDQQPVTPSGAFFTPVPDLGPSAPYGPGRPGQPGRPGRRPGGRTRAALFATGVGAGLLAVTTAFAFQGGASPQTLAASSVATSTSTAAAEDVVTPPSNLDSAAPGEIPSDGQAPDTDGTTRGGSGGTSDSSGTSGAGGSSGSSGAGGTGGSSGTGGSGTGTSSGGPSGATNPDGGTGEPAPQNPGTDTPEPQDASPQDPGTKDPDPKGPGSDSPAQPAVEVTLTGLPSKTMYVGHGFLVKAKAVLEDGTAVPSNKIQWILVKDPLSVLQHHNGSMLAFAPTLSGQYKILVSVSGATGGRVYTFKVVPEPTPKPKPKPMPGRPGGISVPQPSPF